jgi:hypothetical protein
MNKNLYKYNILKDKNLIIEVLRGSFVLAEFVNLKKSESEDPDFDPNFNSILDIRNLENTFSEEISKDLERFSGIIKTLQPIPKRKRTAVITRTPAQVTGITWYKLIDDRGIDYEVFSTLERATDWLGIRKTDLENIDFSTTDN